MKMMTRNNKIHHNKLLMVEMMVNNMLSSRVLLGPVVVSRMLS